VIWQPSWPKGNCNGARLAKIACSANWS
jgi:hypothetical protein